MSENIVGRYGRVYCLHQPPKHFLKYFGIFLENLGGRYERVYLRLLNIFKNILEYFWKIWVAGMGVFTSASSGLMFCTNFSDSLLMLKFVRWTKLFEMFSGSFEYGSVANLCASCYFWKYCWIVCFFHELGKLYRRLQLEISSVVTIKQDCLLFH